MEQYTVKITTTEEGLHIESDAPNVVTYKMLQSASNAVFEDILKNVDEELARLEKLAKPEEENAPHDL